MTYENVPSTHSCEWFAMCENYAVTTRYHPILKDVPICNRCNEKMTRIARSARYVLYYDVDPPVYKCWEYVFDLWTGIREYVGSPYYDLSYSETLARKHAMQQDMELVNSNRMSVLYFCELWAGI